ncbi:158bf439-c5dd-4334-897f-a2579791bd3f [Thermothielavioides terrestris]|uniref:Dehydrogenase FUB6 n=1 Tax=Thermothielavioides terrestris TaxID=2587410 RepID=A0A3S4F551_9PEZI|nr:158bf439-c5dd-4334-897f-a2579791bd3f [Thermothielavioides terrestris]
MARQSLQLELAERPTGAIVPGRTFRLRRVAAPTEADLRDGQLLLESLYVSFDPAMRGWLDDRRSYVPPVRLGEVMRAQALCRVLASRSARAAPGDIVTALMGIREVGIVSEDQVEPAVVPWRGAGSAGGGFRVTDLLGVLGPTGLTAYFGMTKIGAPRPGETVVVSAAAGATGSVAAQIAKIAGARVVGTAGSDEKCRWLTEELGLDAALNYKDPDFRDKFKAATPKYIDVFFDNVGGEQLDMALGRANKNARFVMCGAISQYNSQTKSGPTRNFANIIAQRIKMQGFIVFDYVKEYSAAQAQLAKWLSEGKLKRKETIIKGGVAAADEAFKQLFQGGNIGKLLVEIKNPEEVARL